MNKKRYLSILAFTLIFNVAFSQYSTLLNFDGAYSGSGCESTLISDGTFLYGMTSSGGTHNKGTIFKIMPNGSGYTKLLDFAGTTNGSHPYGSLIYDGTFLYGMTCFGGTNDLGTIFKILPNGTGFVKLVDFTCAETGCRPDGSLMFDGTFLYGMTKFGGTHNEGVIFKIMPNGTGFVKLFEFSGIDGQSPCGSLISDGNNLFGMTRGGGTDYYGSIFKIKPDGTEFVKLLDFNGALNGSHPYGSLLFDGTFLYGMTSSGGAADLGTIFKILPDGTGYVKLHSFSTYANGYGPLGSLVTDGNFLYGMTTGGGASSGTIFKIMPDGTGYVKLFDMADGPSIESPRGSLYLDDNSLYGTTYNGGTNGYGVVFKFGGIAEIDEKSSEPLFSIFPNPSNGEINISSSINGVHLMSVTNCAGEIVLSKEVNVAFGSTFKIDMSDKPKGVYFLRINDAVEKILWQ